MAEDSEDLTVVVTEEDRQSFKRLDQFLAEKLPFSRSTIKRLFEDEDITSPERSLSLNKMPPAGTTIEIEVPPPIPTDLIAENIPLEILFEDPHLIIINKPAGLVVHPAPGHYTGTLVNAVLHHCPDLKGIGAERRPGIVHRLDMGTSGVMVIAKDQPTHEGLVSLFSVHDIERKYVALVAGAMKNKEGTIRSTMGRHPTNRLKMAAEVQKGGKKAVTHYKLLESFTGASLVELKLETGRTHQIRVHMSQVLHNPVLCDPLYGQSAHLSKLPDATRLILKEYPHQLLHAKELGFIHPITKTPLHFSAPTPSTFQDALRTLQSQQ